MSENGYDFTEIGMDYTDPGLKKDTGQGQLHIFVLF